MKDVGHSFSGGSPLLHQGRATPTEVSEQASLCLDDPMIHAVLEAVDSFAVILNPQRQILAANPALLEALAQEDSSVCRGLRLGEALGCVHRDEGFEGCGTSRACKRCGALLAILASHSGEQATGECLINMKRGDQWEAREFAARSLPMTVAGHQLTLLTLKDISAQKRRETLERLFIHDLKNSLQGLRGWTEILQGAGADATEIAGRILDVAGRLTAEVESQHRLLQAEQGELVPDLRDVTPGYLLTQLMESLGPDAASRLIHIPSLETPPLLRTDPAILGRVLENMARNALEALPTGGQAQIWYEPQEDGPTFTVQNPGCMPPEVADRVFHRSFSTKAARGRGLGTYGMKVLGESVLGGKVGFTTSWEEGTRFFIQLPARG